MKIKILALLIGLTGTASYAADLSMWNCAFGRNALNIESAGVWQTEQGLSGSVSWDCFPGDGICQASTRVTQSTDANDDLVFRGNHFWLIIHISQAETADGYKAHMIATDEVDPKDAGQGFKFDEFLACKCASH